MMDLDIEIKNTSWEQRLSENLQDLLNKRDFCDLKIRTSDNQYVYCHLCVVTAFIPYLKVKSVPEVNVTEIYLSDITQEVVQKIVAYCYGGVLSVSAEQVAPLLVAADILQMTELHALLAEEQSKVLQSNMALVKTEGSEQDHEANKNQRMVSGDAKDLEMLYVVNDEDTEVNKKTEDENSDHVDEFEGILDTTDTTTERKMGLRKRKRKVCSFATKKVPLKRQKTAKALSERRKLSTRNQPKGKKSRLHMSQPRLKEQSPDSNNEQQHVSSDLSELEKVSTGPLNYEQFVKEIGPAKFICKVCKKVWPSKEKTVAHVPSHSEENLHRNLNVNLTVECVTCNKWFSTKSHLRAHIKDVHLNPCRRKVFNARFTHLSPFYCPVCEKRFKWASDLKQHLLHHGERQLSRVPGLQLKYACDECRLAFVTKVSCKSHADLYHSADSKYDPEKDLRGRNVYDILYQCDLCEVSCERCEQIEDHLKNVHGKEVSGDQGSKGSKCSTHGEGASHVDIECMGIRDSKRRMGENTGMSEMEKVIKIMKYSDSSDTDLNAMYTIMVTCLKCHAKFSSVVDVRDHKKKAHPSEKPLKQRPPKQAIHMCELCGMRYKNNNSRMIHMHVVHNIQFQMKRKKAEINKSDTDSLKWNCLYCPKRFRQRCGLRVHVVTHHTIEELKQDHRFAERDKANYEYQCHLCKNKMKLYKSLQTHLRRFHGVRISKDTTSEYCDYSVSQKKKIHKEVKHNSIPEQSNVVVNQEQIGFDMSGHKGDVNMTELGINPSGTYQQPAPNLQDVGSTIVQPYPAAQDYVVLNTGLQLTFAGYPPVQ